MSNASRCRITDIHVVLPSSFDNPVDKAPSILFPTSRTSRPRAGVTVNWLSFSRWPRLIESCALIRMHMCARLEDDDDESRQPSVVRARYFRPLQTRRRVFPSRTFNVECALENTGRCVWILHIPVYSVQIFVSIKKETKTRPCIRYCPSFV